MRSSLVAVLVGLSLVACDVGEPIDGGGGGGGGGVDGPAAVPSVAAAIDRMTVTTELGKTETVTLMLTSVDGFTGSVAITPALLNTQSQPLVTTMATVTGPTSILLTAGQIASAQYIVTVPSNASGVDFATTLKLDLVSAAGSSSLSSTLNVAAAYTLTIAPGTGAAIAMHPGTNKSVAVKRGSKLRMKNSDTVVHITHGDNVPHEPNEGGVANATYEVTTTGNQPGTAVSFGCHAHGSATYAQFSIQ